MKKVSMNMHSVFFKGFWQKLSSQIAEVYTPENIWSINIYNFLYDTSLELVQSAESKCLTSDCICVSREKKRKSKTQLFQSHCKYLLKLHTSDAHSDTFSKSKINFKLNAKMHML